MKMICDASEKCKEKEYGDCGHHSPHEEKDGCNWSCCVAKLQDKTGKCVPVMEGKS